MDKYKKRSFGFSKVAEKRELLAKRKSIDRAKHKNQRLSILRHIDVENLELETQDEQLVPQKKQMVPQKEQLVPQREQFVSKKEPNKPPSRLEMLKKWKVEKELKKKMEASQKNPVFKVSKVSHTPSLNLQASSKTLATKLKGCVSFLSKPNPLKLYNQHSTAGAQTSFLGHSTRSVTPRVLNPRSIFTTQGQQQCLTRNVTPKVPNARSGILTQGNIPCSSRSLTPKVPNPHSVFATQGNLSCSTRSTPKVSNPRLGIATQANISVSTRPTLIRNPYQHSTSNISVNNAQSVTTRSKMPDQRSSAAVQQPVANGALPKPVTRRNIPTGIASGIAFRRNKSPLQTNASVTASKNDAKDDVPKHADIPEEIDIQHSESDSRKNEKNDLPHSEKGKTKDSSSGKCGQRSSFAPDDFIFTAPPSLKNLGLSTKGLTPMFADIFETSVPSPPKKLSVKAEISDNSEILPSETKSKLSVEQPIESIKIPSPSLELDVPKMDKRRIGVQKTLQTISETVELSAVSEAVKLEMTPDDKRVRTRRSRRLVSIYEQRVPDFNGEKNSELEDGDYVARTTGTAVGQATSDTPVKRLVNRLHGLLVDSPAAQIKDDSEVRRPLTRLQQRISLLGTPERPQTRARRSIRGDLISFSPSV